MTHCSEGAERYALVQRIIIILSRISHSLAPCISFVFFKLSCPPARSRARGSPSDGIYVEAVPVGVETSLRRLEGREYELANKNLKN